jgi:hypothetical protein
MEIENKFRKNIFLHGLWKRNKILEDRKVALEHMKNFSIWGKNR